ncbi:MAG TPA: S8 family serine peptidase, partial [Micromonospora sp.]
DSDLRDAIEYARRKNVVLVAAVGNKPNDPIIGYPAAYPGVIAVGGVDQHGQHVSFSVTGKEVDIAAPAVDIVSTGTGGRYSRIEGTSYATAIVAGAAALIRARYPDLSADEVAYRLLATAVDKGPKGRDEQYGYGVLDIYAALTAELPPMPDDFVEPLPTQQAAPPPAVPPPPAAASGAASKRPVIMVSLFIIAGGVFLLALAIIGLIVWIVWLITRR